jgi:hypothetical protein
MATLSPEEIAHGLGVAPPPKTQPAGRVGAAMDALKQLDDRLQKMATADRQPGESEAAAAGRFHLQNPQAYEMHKRERGKILAAHGIGDAPTGL